MYSGFVARGVNASPMAAATAVVKMPTAMTMERMLRGAMSIAISMLTTEANSSLMAIRP